MEEELSTLKVKIRSRTKVHYEGEAIAVTSINDKGLFDILPQHANFISIIKDKIVVHISDKEEKKFEIEKGLLKTVNNTVDIYLELTAGPTL